MSVKVIAEIGINHSGDIDAACKLIDVAASAGCDYVKFQKRTPELCVPESQKNILKDTPWGEMTYLEYKKRLEFDKSDYAYIALHCRERNIKWTASIWDLASLDFISEFKPDFIKIPSALISDTDLLEMCSMGDDKFILSTGMADWKMVDKAVSILKDKTIALMHCVSTYPSKVDEQNLNCIVEMAKRYDIPVGFSNHYPGIILIPVAVALGATWIEMHITLDRSSWGTDQASSIEPEGVYKIMKYVRNIEKAMGDGEKRILESEIPIMNKLRRQCA